MWFFKIDWCKMLNGYVDFLFKIFSLRMTVTSVETLENWRWFKWNLDYVELLYFLNLNNDVNIHLLMFFILTQAWFTNLTFIENEKEIPYISSQPDNKNNSLCFFEIPQMRKILFCYVKVFQEKNLDFCVAVHQHRHRYFLSIWSRINSRKLILMSTESNITKSVENRYISYYKTNLKHTKSLTIFK